MPRSQFTECRLTDDNKVKVTGTVDADGPVHVHWLVEQGDLMGAGVTTSKDGSFEDTEARAQSWEPGSATVIGLQVGAGRSDGGRAGLETFTWSQTIDL
jgi:hypothetical protein